MTIIDSANHCSVSVGGGCTDKDDEAANVVGGGAAIARGSGEDNGGICNTKYCVCCCSDLDSVLTKIYRCPLAVRLKQTIHMAQRISMPRWLVLPMKRMRSVSCSHPSHDLAY